MILEKQNRDLISDLEEERKQRNAAISARKKAEMECNKIEQQLEHANNVKEDTLRQVKKLQSEVKEFQRVSKVDSFIKDEFTEHLRELEKNMKVLKEDMNHAQDDLVNSERMRRSAEDERNDLQEEIKTKLSKMSLLQDEKRRLVGRIHQLEEELDHEHEKSVMQMDKACKSQILLEQLKNDLAYEKSRSEKLEINRMIHETEIRDLKSELVKERKQRNAEILSWKIVETDVKAIEMQLIKVKEDAFQQQKKLQTEIKEFQHGMEGDDIIKED